MSPRAQITAFAQSVYLVIKNRYFDDIEGEDGVIYVNQIIDWANQMADELETLIDPMGEPVNWTWLREMAAELGTIDETTTTVELPRGVQSLIADEQRYVQIQQDGTPVSHWAVVSPEQLSNFRRHSDENYVTNVGGNLNFSRPFREEELGGTIVGDVINSIPRLSLTNARMLTTVTPKQLLILGVAKNATLPDIVQGGLSPSYVQKYNDLLQSAILRNQASSRSNSIERDRLSYIGGVY